MIVRFLMTGCWVAKNIDFEGVRGRGDLVRQDMDLLGLEQDWARNRNVGRDFHMGLVSKK